MNIDFIGRTGARLGSFGYVLQVGAGLRRAQILKLDLGCNPWGLCPMPESETLVNWSFEAPSPVGILQKSL
jgi:hypothetical protein